MDVTELLQFLSLDTRADVRSMAVEYLLGITGDKESGHAFFASHPKILEAIVEISKDIRYAPVAKDAVSALINLSIEPMLGGRLIELDMVKHCVHQIVDDQSPHPDGPVMVLANLTRDEKGAQALCEMTLDDRPALYALVNVFCKTKGQDDKGNFHYLANVFFNVTQTKQGRDLVLARADGACILQRLLVFTEYQESTIRRGGVIGALRNCCFSVEDHPWLLSDEVELLPKVLLPLAGPEEFEEEEMEGMPDDLQYLPPEKERESDADIRRMLLEILQLLCATRPCRVKLRDAKVYPILRELHKWESEEDVREQCEEVVQLLLREEHEHPENLLEVDIPHDAKEILEDVKAKLASGQGPQIEFVPEESDTAD